MTTSDSDDVFILQKSNGLTAKITKENLFKGFGSTGNNQFNLGFLGDKRGVIYFLGTEGYSKPFANPAINGTVTTSQSSNHNNSNPASNLSDRADKVAHTTAAPNQWFSLDLGKQFILKCLTLKARDDGNIYHPADWSFQGSDDNINWTIICSAKTSMQQAVWYGFDCFENSKAYRYFRLFQSLNTYLTLGEWELYGSLV